MHKGVNYLRICKNMLPVYKETQAYEAKHEQT